MVGGACHDTEYLIGPIVSRHLGLSSWGGRATRPVKEGKVMIWEEPGFIETGLFVCVDHFRSQTARQCVAKSAESQPFDAECALQCFVCQRTPAGSLDTLIELVLENAGWLYEPYETSTAAGTFHKEFGDQSTDTYEMIDLLTGADDPVCVAIVEALSNTQWISSYWERGGLGEHVIADWDEFAFALKHRARFTVLEYLLEHEPRLYTVVAGTLARLSDASPTRGSSTRCRLAAGTRRRRPRSSCRWGRRLRTARGRD
jgi:hypothetical protein